MAPPLVPADTGLARCPRRTGHHKTGQQSHRMNWRARSTLAEEVTFKLRPAGVGHGNSGNSTPGRGNSRCRELGVGWYQLTCCNQDSPVGGAREPWEAGILCHPVIQLRRLRPGIQSDVSKVTQQRQRGHRHRPWAASRVVSTPRHGLHGVCVWSWGIFGFLLLEGEKLRSSQEAAGSSLGWGARGPS